MSSDKPESDPFEAVLDELVPGDGGRWPPFSAAVVCRTFAAGLAPADRDALTDVAGPIAALPPPERADAIAAWERAAPAAFAAIMRAVHRAYYTAPAVLAAVAALADAGPREPSPHFDPDLVATVVATEAGKRRL